MAGTSIFAATPSIFESLVFKLIFIVKPLPGSVAGGGKRKKWDETKEIGERSEPSGGLGRGEGGRAS